MMMTCNKEIEFIKEGHLYLVNGVITPSVTQIVSMITGDEYSDVPSSVLEAKATYGTRVHEWCERFALTGEELPQTATMKLSTDQFKNWLQNYDNLVLIATEGLVSYEDRYVGTYDMLFKNTVTNQHILYDIKTTALLHNEALRWQENLYRLAIESAGIHIDLMRCLWLPKMDILDDVETPFIEDETILKKLEELGI